MERLVLLANHVLQREPQATARLRMHAGKVLRLHPQGAPRLFAEQLDQALPLAFAITPAGLLEWSGNAAAPDLRVQWDVSNPAQLALDALRGRQPALQIEGDAQLAADLDWLLKNLRWDIADDLQRLFGPAVAGQLQQFGSALGKALRGAVLGTADLAERVRGR